ncbi:DUF2304 domain-containing protein [Xylanimonas oleitrophica]|uniref:DUF2304 domain-containing protein n=1 Tax=Xylanimonas oleitrophica TaxID=2607479 RepID=A0A2W5WUP7_9MICO|nr:DUF2304 domain-containing protein [Xylanimonas oleitrophica]PZR54343.1 DUF2304 domain-containing protein [Xylanimonas oleitrophica]
MSGYVFALTMCVLLVVFLLQLLRRRWIREKYAGIWIVLAVGVAVLGAFPQLAVRVSRLAGVEVPANLVFATAIVTLLVVCIQLSVGVSQLDEKVRTLTEEVAILRLQVEASTLRPPADPAGVPPRPGADEQLG